MRRIRPLAAEAYRLQGTCDWLRGRERQARQCWDKSLTLATEIGQPYELAMTYREMGLRFENGSYLEKSGELLEEIGARPDLVEKTVQFRKTINTDRKTIYLTEQIKSHL